MFARGRRGAGASGCASLRVAVVGLRALSREASRGFAPQSRGGDAQQPGGGEGRAMQTRQNLELPKQAQYGIIGIKLQTQCNSTPQTNSDG